MSVQSSREFWRAIHPPVEKPTLRILSHGGGVQTSTLLFMAERGEIDRPDAAIMGDGGNEPQAVYDYLAYASERTRIPVYLYNNANILEHIRRSKGLPDGKQLMALPYYLADGGRMMRTCTNTVKIEAVTKQVRQLLGLTKGQRVPLNTRVEVMIGISTDEKSRAGGFPAERWQSVRYPLLEEEMSFGDCLRWLDDRQYKRAPRSRCIVCPFRSNESWRQLTKAEFEQACEVDDFIREGGTPPRGYQSLPYLHADRVPLRQVDLSRVDLFPEDDCTGSCST